MRSVARTVFVALFFPALMTVNSVEAEASNPLIRECRIAGGIFDAVPVGLDDIPLCRFGRAVIDAQTLLSKREGHMTRAAEMIIGDRRTADCHHVGASTLPLPGGETLCAFGDGSKLGLNTLESLSGDRLRLKSALLQL